MASLIGLAVAGAGIWSASKSSKSTKKGLDSQLEEMARIRAENQKIAKETLSTEQGIIDSLPSLSSLLKEGGDIADSQRQNLLDFVMGTSQNDLRSAQQTNAQIANFDFSSLNNDISKILRSNQFDVIAASAGEPIGTIANLSAQNVNAFAQQGLSNYLAISDFFAKTGQVDRFNPYSIATDLYKVEEGQINAKIGIQESYASRMTQSNNNWAASFADISNAQIANQANKYAAYNSAIANGFSAYSGASSLKTNRTVADAQVGFYNAQTSKIGA